MTEALKSDKQKRLGAVIYKGRKGILAVGHNHSKGHPLSQKATPDSGLIYCDLHAEIDALIGCRWYDSVKGASIFVARLMRQDDFPGMAKPCERCQKTLREHGIKKMYYTTGKGYEVLMEKL